MWLHTYRKRRSYIEREKYFDFRKGREIKERKVDFLKQNWVFGGWHKYIKKKDCKREERKRKGKGDVSEEEEGRGILWWSGVEEEQLQPTLSRYVSGYSGCSDPYLISPFWSFLNIQCLVCLVWTERPTSCFVEIGCLLVCLVLILILLYIVGACWNMWLRA